MQILMFLILGLQVFLARPVAVFLCLAFSAFNLQEKLLIAWVGLRGAVPIILATFPLLADVPNAGYIFDLVFFIVLTSVLLQVTSLARVVGYLGLARAQRPKPRYALEFEEGEGMAATLTDFIIPYNSAVIDKPLVELGLPDQSVIALISRNNEYIVPTGTTRLQGGDVLLIILDKAAVPQAHRILSTPSQE